MRRLPPAIHVFTRLAVFAVLLTLMCVPCVVRAADPVEINVIVSQTGAGAFLGSKTMQSLSLAEKSVNAGGGINGRPLKFIYNDDGTNPQTAVQLANALIAKKAQLMIGANVVATCAALIPVIAANGPVSYCLAAPVQGATGSFIFTQGTNASESVAAAFRYYKSRKLMRIGLMTATDASGQAFEKDVDAFLSSPEGSAFELVDREHFNNSDLSMAAQVARMKSKAPQALLTFAIGPPFGTLLRSLSDGGVNLPTVGSAGDLSYAQLEPYKAFAPPELLFPSNEGAAPDADAKPAVKTAQAAFFKAFRDAGVRAEMLHAISWDPAMLYVSALRKLSPDASAAQIRDYLAGLKGWAGVFGTYDFTKYPQRGLGGDALVMYRWDAIKGEIVPVPLPKP